MTQSDNKEVNEEYDVIIVGAGVSGLTAAFTILEKDPTIKLLILEKSDRCKGNSSVEDLKNAFSFISSTNYFLQELLKKINLPIVKRKTKGKILAQCDSGDILASDEEIPLFGSALKRLELLLFFAKLEKLSQEVSFIQPMSLIESSDLDKITMDDFIKENLSGEFSKNFAAAIAESTCGASVKKFSALFYVALCNSTSGVTNQFTTTSNDLTGYLLQGGKKLFCETLLINPIGIKTEYKRKVSKVSRSPDYVLIETNALVYRCLYAVIAISPMDILDILMVPDLTKTRMRTLKGFTQGNLNSSLITYSKDFWSNKNLSGDAFCGVKTGSNVLVRCINITKIRPYTFFAITSQNQEENVFGQMKRLFKINEMPESFIKLPSFKTCIPPIGNLKGLQEIRRPVNRVFWTGSYTATTWYGQLEGSVQSGTKTAIELMYDYKPQTLVVNDIVNLMRRKSNMDKFSENTLVNAVENKKFYFVTVALSGFVLWLTYRKLRKLIK